MTVPPYKVLVLTCMVNCTAGKPTPQLCSVVWWSVHWAPSQTTWFLVLAGARHFALETCGGKKKMRALLLAFAKSIHNNYLCHLHTFCKPYVCRYILQLYFRSTLFSSPVVSALGSESDDPSSSPGRGKALCLCAGKKNASCSFRLG